MEKIWDTKRITNIEVVSNQVSSVVILSNKSDSIKLTTKVEGENYKQVMLEVLEKDSTLFVRPVFSPFFQPNNDKLSVHKVLSVEMIFEVPEKINAHINSSLASVSTQGYFNQLYIKLLNGNCRLINFKGNAVLWTQNGNISATVKENVSAIAKSNKGAVKNYLPTTAKYIIEAKSINGNISLQKKQ